LPHDLLRKEYRTASVLVNPSFSESFGMSLIEAMACGTPVIATRVGGMTEVVDGVGRLTECGDAPALADAILSVLGNETAGAHAGGRERVLQRYAWDRVAETLERCYEGIPDRTPVGSLRREREMNAAV
jgi:glycosyltransferase involved in cell wall biosynthesis